MSSLLCNIRPWEKVNNTHCGGSVAFSMMQTRLRLDLRSMWYSSSAKMKASGVSTFNSTRCERMPSSVVTYNRINISNFFFFHKYELWQACTRKRHNLYKSCLLTSSLMDYYRVSQQKRNIAQKFLNVTKGEKIVKICLHFNFKSSANPPWIWRIFHKPQKAVSQ